MIGLFQNFNKASFFKEDSFLLEFEDVMAEVPFWFQDFVLGTSIWDIFRQYGFEEFLIGAIGWSLATLLERQHDREMDEREKALEGLTLNSSKLNFDAIEGEGTLLVGSSVVAHDFFRSIVIMFKKLVGGNIKAYERLIQRARREALIRLKEESNIRGFNKIINVKFGNCQVSGKFLSAVEVVAYGTAIKILKT